MPAQRMRATYIGGITRERDSHHINIDKRRTFIGLDPVLFQLPQPYLILYSHRDQWFLNEKQSREGQSATDGTTCDPTGQLHRGAGWGTHVLPHLGMRVRGQVADDLSSVLIPPSENRPSWSVY